MNLAENVKRELLNVELIEELKLKNDIILFGAGRSGDYFFDILKRNLITPRCYCDNYKPKQGSKRNQVMILSFEEAIQKYPNAAICITSVFGEEIYQQICGFNKNLEHQIYFVMNTMSWETDDNTLISDEDIWINENLDQLNHLYDQLQDDYSKKTLEGILNYRITRDFAYINEIYSGEETYFDRTLFPEGGEGKYSFFLDGGSFVGDTIKPYLNFTNNMYEKIMCFEPDMDCVKSLKENAVKWNINKLQIYTSALWDTCGEIEFFQSGACGGTISSNSKNSIKIKTEAIDELQIGRIDFVKLGKH